MTHKEYIFHFGAAQESIADVQQILKLQSSIVIPKQMHGTIGHLITHNNYQMPPHFLEGDFLVTNMSAVGLGVLTADCLPIIFLDKHNRAIGIAHVGWRGAIRNIIAQIIACMHHNYGTVSENITTIFGPCAQACCYTVRVDFISELISFGWDKAAVVYRNNSFFFDQLYFSKQILLSLGVSESAIIDTYSTCTICDKNFFSYRRQGNDSGRQLSAVAQFLR